MIVKDETPVIARCLASVLPFVDTWVIVDTGSTDGTQGIVRELAWSKPGELHERPWVSFDHNRNEALELARGTAEYVLFIDADETLRTPGSFHVPALEGDGYYVSCEYAGTTYRRCALISAALPWHWEGVVHECLTCNRPVTLGSLAGPTIVVAHDGARSRDPLTYLKDAALLEEAVRRDPENARNVFYLAQSYRDAGELGQSRDWYRRRAAMGGWDEEVWFSLYQAAVLDERLGTDAAMVSAAYLRAFQHRPTRAEPLVALARFHRLRREYAVACIYAEQAVACPRPSDALFIEDAVYEWRALDELSISAFYAGRLDEGRAAILRLLNGGSIPAIEERRILQNCEFYFPRRREPCFHGAFGISR
jgi:glycosyltransferase involved in cell wall biosynthesis